MLSIINLFTLQQAIGHYRWHSCWFTERHFLWPKVYVAHTCRVTMGGAPNGIQYGGDGGGGQVKSIALQNYTLLVKGQFNWNTGSFYPHYMWLYCCSQGPSIHRQVTALLRFQIIASVPLGGKIVMRGLPRGLPWGLPSSASCLHIMLVCLCQLQSKQLKLKGTWLSTMP